jgi:hypothetical protein
MLTRATYNEASDKGLIVMTRERAQKTIDEGTTPIVLIRNLAKPTHAIMLASSR